MQYRGVMGKRLLGNGGYLDLNSIYVKKVNEYL